MYIRKLLVYAITSITYLTVNAQLAQPPRLTLSNLKAEVNRTISFSYYPQQNNRAEYIRPVLFYFAGKSIYAADVQAIVDNGILKGDFVLPDSALAFAMSFKTGEGRQTKTDGNSGAGFIYPVYKNGSPTIGSLAAEAVFFNDQGGSYFSGIQYDPKRSMRLLQQEFSSHPAQAKVWNKEYLFILAATDKTQAYQKIQTDWKSAVHAKSSENTLIPFTELMMVLGKEEEAKEFSTQIKNRFPKGLLSTEVLVNQVMNDINSDSLELKTQQMEYKLKGNDKSRAERNISYIYNVLSQKAIAVNDYQKVRYDIAQITDKRIKAASYNYIVTHLLTQDTLLSWADSLAHKALVVIEKQKAEDIARPSVFTKTDLRNNLKAETIVYLDSYASVCDRVGRSREALHIQQEVIELDKTQVSMNGHYVKYLFQNTQFENALKQGALFVSLGTANDELIDYLKRSYIAVRGTDQNFDNYISSLNTASASLYQKKVLPGMVHLPVAGFTLKDLSGKAVSLAELKGKIVILDFWATWCGPCKASFPGMQKLINQYKNDHDVVFLFIDTWENIKSDFRMKEVKKVTDEKGYQFHILLDEKNDSDFDYHLAVKYALKAVPTKFILDKQGFLRFRIEGFEGNNDELVNELNAMIEVARN